MNTSLSSCSTQAVKQEKEGKEEIERILKNPCKAKEWLESEDTKS